VLGTDAIDSAAVQGQLVELALESESSIVEVLVAGFAGPVPRRIFREWVLE
jgi:hypothetical protein